MRIPGILYMLRLKLNILIINPSQIPVNVRPHRTPRRVAR